MTWRFTSTRILKIMKKVLSGMDFKVKISFKIANVALFQKFSLPSNL